MDDCVSMILQRCINKQCRTVFPLNVRACPRCKIAMRANLRFLIFRKKVRGKPHFKTFGYSTLVRAEAEYAKWIGEIVSKPRKPDADITIEEMADAYLDKLRAEGKRYGDSHAKLFLERLKNYCSKQGIFKAADLQAGLLNQFQAVLRDQGSSPAYVDRHFAMYRAAWYHRFGKGLRNPFSEVRFYKPDNTLIRFLTVEEQRRLVTAAKKLRTRLAKRGPRLFPEMIILALQTGMRADNVFNLHSDQVNFDTGQIKVRQKRDLNLTVEMNSLVSRTLRRISPQEPGHFFVNPRTGKPFKDLRDAWEMVKAAAEITRPFRFHDLRHTFGTTFGELTGDLRATMEAMGHRSIATTMKYWHVRREKIREGMEALAEQMSTES
jgi:integrase